MKPDQKWYPLNSEQQETTDQFSFSSITFGLFLIEDDKMKISSRKKCSHLYRPDQPVVHEKPEDDVQWEEGKRSRTKQLAKRESGQNTAQKTVLQEYGYKEIVLQENQY